MRLARPIPALALAALLSLAACGGGEEAAPPGGGVAEDVGGADAGAPVGTATDPTEHGVAPPGGIDGSSVEAVTAPDSIHR